MQRPIARCSFSAAIGGMISAGGASQHGFTRHTIPFGGASRGIHMNAPPVGFHPNNNPRDVAVFGDKAVVHGSGT